MRDKIDNIQLAKVCLRRRFFFSMFYGQSGEESDLSAACGAMNDAGRDGSWLKLYEEK